MIKFVENLIKNPLFGGSATMIIGSNVANAVAYLYHLVIGRLLGPSDYGELSAIISVLGLLFTSFNFLGLVIVKFISSATKTEIPFIFNWFNKKTFVAGAIFSIILLFTNGFVSNFLHVEYKETFFIAPIVFFAFLTFVYRSFAQGLLKFWIVVISTNLDLVTRFFAALVFIYLGYSVTGAVFGIFVSMALSFLYLNRKIKSFIQGRITTDAKFASKVFKYSIPILAATLTTNSMITTDVILVKHYFEPYEAGIYASLSTLGKIIFYGTGPVSAVMFPLISKKFSKGENINKVFFFSFLITFAMISAILLVYYLFPEISIKVLFGDKFLDGVPYLFLFGIFVSLYALSSLIFNFFLSIEKTKVTLLALIISIAQIAGIIYWHRNIFEVIQVSIYSMTVFLLALCAYYLYYAKGIKQAPKN